MTYIDRNSIMDSTLTPETFEYPATRDHARPYLEANYPSSTLPRAYELEQPYVLSQLVLLEEAHGIESTDTRNNQE